MFRQDLIDEIKTYLDNSPEAKHVTPLCLKVGERTIYFLASNGAVITGVIISEAERLDANKVPKELHKIIFSFGEAAKMIPIVSLNEIKLMVVALAKITSLQQHIFAGGKILIETVEAKPEAPNMVHIATSKIQKGH